MIYLASPYSHPDKAVEEQRFLAVEEMTATLLAQGKHVYSPIVHCHNISRKWELPSDAAHWIRYNFSMLRRCDILYIYTIEGWDKSKGVEMEAWFAKQCGLPSFLIDQRGVTRGYDY